MGLLTLTQVAQLQPYLERPLSGSQMFVYAPGTDNLSPIFGDEDLTETRPNPVMSDANGNFPLCYLLNGTYRVVIRSNQSKPLGEAQNVVVSTPVPNVASVEDLLSDQSLDYNAGIGKHLVRAGDIVRTSRGGYVYQVADVAAIDSHLTTAGGVKLYLDGRSQFSPEAFGAKGDGMTNDTAAWNLMFKAALLATATGPVRVFARSTYLLDQLNTLSQAVSTPDMPIQQSSMTLDFEGAGLEHSGVGDGILSFEGTWTERHRYEILGGIWQAHANTRWLMRGHDVRGSTFLPEALLGPSDCYGILLQNWRSWSENNQFGGARTLEGRRLGRILGFQGRREAWAYELTVQGAATSADDYQGELSTAPASATDGDYYFDTTTQSVNRYAAGGWVSLLSIEDVQTDVTGKSFARTKVRNVLAASANDFSQDGIIVHVDGASLYDSEINGVRGNVTNDGGSLIYWNANYALNTVIRNVGVEKANEAANATSYLFRAGPGFAVATEPPELVNVNWAGGHAEVVDPAAGVVFSGQVRDSFINTTPSVPETVLHAGQFWLNTTVEVVVKSNSNLVLGRALVASKNSGTSLRIEDTLANRVTAGPWSADGITASTGITEMDGPRWIAPANGWVTAITLISDTARTAGTCTAAVRHNTGVAGATGASIGLSAVLDSTNTLRDTNRQNSGVDGFSIGDEIYAIITSNSAWAPGTANVRAIIEVQLDGDVSWQDSSGDLTLTTDTSEVLRVMTKVWKP